MKKARILVVEDEGIVAMAIRASLESMGYEVAGTVATGEAAVREAQKNHLDLVLMDIRLAGPMTGIEAAERIRRLVEVPVVFLTAHSDKDTLRQAKVSLPHGYIVKPYDDNELYAAVEIAIHNSRVDRERREADNAVRARDRLLQDLIDNSSAVIALKDLQGRYLLVNTAFEEAHGVLRSDVRGKTDRDLFPTERAREAARLDRAVLDSGQPRQDEETLLGKGRQGTFLSVRFPLKNPDGAAYGVCTLSTDITERKRAEEALRLSEHQYRLLADNATEIVSVSAADGRIRYVSPSCARVLGFAPEDLVGTPWQDLVHPEDAPQVEAALDAWGSPGGTARRVAYRAREKNGGYVWVESALRAATPEEADAERGTLISVTREVSERQEAEAEIRRLREVLDQRMTERLRELAVMNQNLESFTYSVSHDLRAPLRGIDYFATALAEDHGARLEEEGREYLARLRTESKRLRELVDDLLKLSSTDRTEITRAPVHLSEVARSVLDDLQAQDPKRHVDVTVAEGLVAHADARLLRVVLTNLLGNAWKYTVGSEAPAIEVGSSTVDGAEAFFVRDNGIGFPAGESRELFKPFKRLENAWRHEGTGIGLSTVERIVSRHGGRVWAESDGPGKGATFWFTLPRPEPEEARPGRQEDVALRA